MNSGTRSPRRLKKRSAPKNRTVGFDVITAFPDAFLSYLGESLMKKALDKGIVRIALHDLKKFGRGRRTTIDDKPFGGGPGMVLQIGPIYEAIRSIERKTAVRNSGPKSRVILFSPRGKKMTARIAKRLSKYGRLILICGRYEGVDERVAHHIADEEISIGDYVLSGGELPALVLIEAVSRFVPGFLGKQESLEDTKGSYPAYTRPEAFSPAPGITWRVPNVLTSGNHARIEEWRRRMSSSE